MTLKVVDIAETHIPADDKSWLCNCIGCINQRKYAKEESKRFKK